MLHPPSLRQQFCENPPPTHRCHDTLRDSHIVEPTPLASTAIECHIHAMHAQGQACTNLPPTAAHQEGLGSGSITGDGYPDTGSGSTPHPRQSRATSKLCYKGFVKPWFKTTLHEQAPEDRALSWRPRGPHSPLPTSMTTQTSTPHPHPYGAIPTRAAYRPPSLWQATMPWVSCIAPVPHQPPCTSGQLRTQPADHHGAAIGLVTQHA